MLLRSTSIVKENSKERMKHLKNEFRIQFQKKTLIGNFDFEPQLSRC